MNGPTVLGGDPVLVYRSAAGDLYGLCSLECKDAVAHYLLWDPTMTRPVNTDPALHGCWWCGADLTGGQLT